MTPSTATLKGLAFTAGLQHVSDGKRDAFSLWLGLPDDYPAMNNGFIAGTFETHIEAIDVLLALRIGGADVSYLGIVDDIEEFDIRPSPSLERDQE